MLKQFLLIAIFSLSVLVFGQTNPLADIWVNAPCLSGHEIKIAYSMGNSVLLKDTILLDIRGTGNSNEVDHKGIFFLIINDSTSYEFMIADSGEYKIFINESEKSYDYEITGNYISVAYDSYLKNFASYALHIDSLKSAIKQTVNDSAIAEMQKTIRNINGSYDETIMRTIEQYRGTLLADYLLSVAPIRIPPTVSLGEGVQKDSISIYDQLLYFQLHYLDNLILDEPGLIYTPIITGKIDTYLDKIIAQDTTEYIKAIDNILTNATNDEVYQFILNHLYYKFKKTKYKPLNEYIYVFLVEEYLTKLTIDITDDLIDIKHIKHTLLGNTMPDIQLPGLNNTIYRLSDIKSEYTLILFWELDCSNCKRILNDLINIITKYNYLSLKVMTIYTGDDIEKWFKVAPVKLPSNWYNTYETSLQKASGQYNINTLPTLYLLDKKNKIINKNFTIRELDLLLLKIAKGY